MILMVCVDDRNGMMFHNRRQSRDRFLIRRILEQAGDRRIWMSGETAKLFAGWETEKICTDAHFFQKAGPGEFCFVENPAYITGQERIEKIFRYLWNRVYPGDAFFPIALSDWTRCSAKEFAGYSHKTITEEIYIK